MVDAVNGRIVHFRQSIRIDEIAKIGKRINMKSAEISSSRIQNNGLCVIKAKQIFCIAFRRLFKRITIAQIESIQEMDSETMNG